MNFKVETVIVDNGNNNDQTNVETENTASASEKTASEPIASPEKDEKYGFGEVSLADMNKSVGSKAESEPEPIKEISYGFSEMSLADLIKLKNKKTAVPETVEEVQAEEVEQVEEVQAEEVQQVEEVQAEEVEQVGEVQAEEVEQVEEVQAEEVEKVEEVQAEEVEQVDEVQAEEVEKVEEVQTEEIAQAEQVEQQEEPQAQEMVQSEEIQAETAESSEEAQSEEEADDEEAEEEVDEDDALFEEEAAEEESEPIEEAEADVDQAVKAEILEQMAVQPRRKYLGNGETPKLDGEFKVIPSDKNQFNQNVQKFLKDAVKDGIKLGYLDKYDGLTASEIKDEYDDELIYEVAEQEYKRVGLRSEDNNGEDGIAVYVFDYTVKNFCRVGFIDGSEASAALKPYVDEKDNYIFNICGIITGGKFKSVETDKDSGKTKIKNCDGLPYGIELDISVFENKK